MAADARAARAGVAVGVDASTWRRGRGWALWKALIGYGDPGAKRVVDEVLKDSLNREGGRGVVGS